ncbi:MAG: molybdopterin molybdotransferase MoeA [Anaerolineae bacterium]
MADRETYPLLSVEAAQELVLSRFAPLPAVAVPILQSLGLVLAEDVAAEADVPPRANSAMDGYAVRWRDVCDATEDAPVRLRVAGEVAAGRLPDTSVGPGRALRIMTGAVLPQGADTVVRFEDTTAADGTVAIVRAPRAGANVRAAGEDVRRGEVVLAAGTVVRPQEVGMLASLGRSQALVHRRPRVAVLATGDEVAALGSAPADGHIRDINSYSNAAQVLEAGGEPLLLGVARDRATELAAKLRQATAAGVDLIVTSGGVSVGDFDLVKDVLRSEGRIDFWWVNVKPGKPMAFGLLGDTPLLALPGNPVAAMISFELFARPAILTMLGRRSWQRPRVTARLTSPVRRKDGRRHYLRVRLHQDGDGWLAELTGEQGSGILKSMVLADGLAVIPESCDHLEAGSEVEVILSAAPASPCPAPAAMEAGT